MSDLEEAIREHLELKRRRGADPAEVAREEQEALAPVTRSHPVVVAPPAVEVRPLASAEPALAGSVFTRRQHGVDEDEYEADDAPADVELSEATQEFRVHHEDDWLEDDGA